MSHRAITSLILALAVALAPSPAAAGDGAPLIGAPAGLEDDGVYLSADQVERDNEERIVSAAGVVTIRHREMRLVADSVVYNERTREIVADGNVVLDEGQDRLQGEHLELNLDTRIGFLEHAQGFVQTYYFTGDRIEKRGPDRYFLRGGTFSTCEGVLPDWSFHATSADVTIEEYLHAWNPTLWVKRLPVMYFPYAVFPIKRDRSTGLLIPTISIRGSDGFTVRNSFYWAPRDNFDATLGLDYLRRTGWAARGELRYLLGPTTHGVVEANYLRNTNSDAQSWSVSTRNSHELPLGIHGEAEAFIQSDREFISETGDTIEERSNERTSSSFYLARSWSAWNFSLSGRNEQSLITEERTTLTRFPELTVDRTSTRLWNTDLFLKVAASGVYLGRDDASSDFSTRRLHLAPEMTWPFSLGTAARIIPTAGYALTSYTNDNEGDAETRAIPFYKLGLEGPRPFRIFDLDGGRFEKLKHLVEPRVSYVYTPYVDQDNIPQFDSLDRISRANRLEYSLANTLYGKVRPDPTVRDPSPAPAGTGTEEGATYAAPAPPPGEAAPRSTTQELLRVKLSQSFTFGEGTADDEGHSFSAVEWEARTRPLVGLELWWRGNFDVYGGVVGYQNLSLTWQAANNASLQADWRSARDSNQDFLDLGGKLSLGRIGFEGRSRYNVAEKTFVENRISVKYATQCWDVTLGYVHWTDEYEYSLLLSFKGIGTIVKI